MEFQVFEGLINKGIEQLNEHIQDISQQIDDHINLNPDLVWSAWEVHQWIDGKLKSSK